jgi:hypothetical protein
LRRFLEGQEVSIKYICKIGSFIDLIDDEEFRLQEIEIVLFVLKGLRDLDNGPFELGKGMRTSPKKPFGFGNYVMIDGHQFLVRFY